MGLEAAGVDIFDPTVTLEDVYDPAASRYRRLLPGPPRADGLTGRGVTVAVVDTGVLSHHPDIAPRLRDAVDFTGTTPEDCQGHGTLVTLVLLDGAPEIDIVSVKVIDEPPGDRRNLLAAMAWLETREDIVQVNMSLGSITPRCDGDCEICEGARSLEASGKVVVAAAGNTPGATACPAKAGDAAIVVGVQAAYSGVSPDGIYIPEKEFQIATVWK